LAHGLRRRRTDRSTTLVRALASPRGLATFTGKLLELTAALREGGSVDSSLQRVTTSAVELTGSYQGTLRLLDDSGRRLLLSARAGPPMHHRGSGRFLLGEGFMGWVVLHQHSARTNDPRRDPRFLVRQGQSWMPTALLAAPLLTPTRCIGVLSTARRERPGYRAVDLELLELIAGLSTPYLEIARLQRLNESDPLTLIHNRRYLDERLPLAIEEARRSGAPLSAAIVDLDHFKRVNDTHGHPVGDEVLVEVAERLRQSCRRSDLLARWGGEEFVVLFPGTSLREACVVAERIRLSIATPAFETSAGAVPLTTSLGVAELTAGEDGPALLARADQAVYVAKRAGRDRVASAG